MTTNLPTEQPACAKPPPRHLYSAPKVALQHDEWKRQPTPIIYNQSARHANTALEVTMRPVCHHFVIKIINGIAPTGAPNAGAIKALMPGIVLKNGNLNSWNTEEAQLPRALFRGRGNQRPPKMQQRQ